MISRKEHTIDVGAHRDAPLHMIDTFRSKSGKNISGNHLKGKFDLSLNPHVPHLPIAKAK